MGLISRLGLIIAFLMPPLLGQEIITYKNGHQESGHLLEWGNQRWLLSDHRLKPLPEYEIESIGTDEMGPTIAFVSAPQPKAQGHQDKLKIKIFESYQEKVHWLLDELNQKKITPLLRHDIMKDLTKEPEQTLESLQKILDEESLAAQSAESLIKVLAQWNNGESHDRLGQLTLYQSQADVRHQALEVLAKHEAHTPPSVIKALNHKRKSKRQRAQKVIARLKDSPGIKALFDHTRQVVIAGSGTRSALQHLTQQSYVRDVTAVVAVGAVAFDPEIATVQTGTTLNPRVRLISSLRQTWYEITGNKLATYGDLEAWWQENHQLFD